MAMAKERPVLLVLVTCVFGVLCVQIHLQKTALNNLQAELHRQDVRFHELQTAASFGHFQAQLHDHSLQLQDLQTTTARHDALENFHAQLQNHAIQLQDLQKATAKHVALDSSQAHLRDDGLQIQDQDLQPKEVQKTSAPGGQIKVARLEAAQTRPQAPQKGVEISGRFNRRLAASMSTADLNAVTPTSGCAIVTASAALVYSATPGSGTTNCGSSGQVRCPTCVIGGSHSGITVTIQDCSTWEKTSDSGDISDEMIEFVFVNTDSAQALTIQARTGGGTNVGNAYSLAPYESVVAYCYTGGSNRLFFPDSSESSTYCPKGCDATAPSDRSGTAFSSTTNIDQTNAAELNYIAAGGSWTADMGSDIAALAAQNWDTSSAASNVYSLAAVSGNLVKLGQNGPTTSGSISTPEWDLAAGMTCDVNSFLRC
eukprot:TRINITY_DN76839_c0_g1_i1.p1 TRINITY_DN76839_c0_g1~~TRINITY_DN76839_c0_g1_i1.p1  ORF type:complete len:428 (-),score=75.65 TRINITY_DN76839_c0_g1_i1:172-1455(-)